jgi:mannose-1-phosphate guanylyltransferase/mannose-6-phosphate isomerase
LIMNTSNSKIFPVILSGGSGTRLWPLSRAHYPKQLQPLHTKLSLLQETVSRLTDDNFTQPLVVCNQEHRFIVAEHLKEIGIKPEAIVLEPIGRNTAPAAAVASIIISKQDPNAIILLMPSDHVITDTEAFKAAIKTALPAAIDGSFVTFGIQPTKAETGYGYIKKSNTAYDKKGCFKVDVFVEKPNLADAKTFIDEGDYYWNGGIFLFSASSFIAELERLSPKIIEACNLAVSKAKSDLDFHSLDKATFSACPSISIDYAVMEKSENVVVVPVDMGWNDVGSWDALWQLLDKDPNGNVISGDVILRKTKNSLVRSENTLVTAVGMENTIIVATDDAILVSNRSTAQDVNLIVEDIKSANRSEHLSHSKAYRPWGWFQTLETRDQFQLKIINLNPNSKISLQRHQQRAEHWVVVAGTATVTRGDDIIKLEKNESTYIPIGMVHRLENKTDDRLEIIEVQSGSYLGEDDIERFDDEYGRHN